jgi:hypothetical protein
MSCVREGLSTQFLCMLPRGQPGFVSLGVLGVITLPRDDLIFLFRSAPFYAYAVPAVVVPFGSSFVIGLDFFCDYSLIDLQFLCAGFISSNVLAFDVSIAIGWKEFGQFDKFLAVVPGVDVQEVEPAISQTCGGTLSKVYSFGASFSDEITCGFGTVRVAASRHATGYVECNAPAHSHGIIQFSASPNARDFDTSTTPSVFYTYSNGVALDAYSAVVKGVSTTAVEQRGGQAVVVFVDGLFNDLAIGHLCSFGGESVPALWLNDSAVVCVVPPSPPGFLAVDVQEQRRAGLLSMDGHGYVMFEQSPAVHHILPTEGPLSGCVFAAHGSNLMNVACHFKVPGVDDPVYRMAGALLSSAILLCEASIVYAGLISVHILSTGASLGTGQDFALYLHPSALSQLPMAGSVAGGTHTLVNIDTSFVVAGTSPTCRFGTISIASGALMASSIECFSPAHSPSAVPVSLSFNDKDFTDAAGAYFEYRSAPGFEHVIPQYAFMNGGAQVIVGGPWIGAFDGDGAQYRLTACWHLYRK